MKAIEIKEQYMSAAEAIIPENSPIFMLNLLRFKQVATYGESGEYFEPCTGREAYFNRYIPIFVEMAGAINKEIKPYFFGKIIAGLIIDENENWDNIGLIAYPNFKSFKDIVESEKYKKNALQHRLASIEEYKLLVAIETQPV
jgi:hypothetical protein